MKKIRGFPKSSKTSSPQFPLAPFSSDLRISHRFPSLGSIPAGFPSGVEEVGDDFLSLDDYLITKPQATFLLKVTGDSMKDAGIHPGDVVIIEKGKGAKKGDIIVARIDGEWTLKYLGFENEKPYLFAANKKYLPMYPKQEFLIEGVVVSVIRKYH